MDYINEFVRESNKIEGIMRDPLGAELSATDSILSLDKITIQDITWFVEQIQPGAKLRNQPGMNVRVGRYTPPLGGPRIKDSLESILERAHYHNPFNVHVEYETLHPFTDGNGRSGRALWLWGMKKINKSLPKLGFLHSFYYQTLENS